MQLYRKCTGVNCTDTHVLLSLSSRILKIIVTTVNQKKFSINLNLQPKYVQYSALIQIKTNNTCSAGYTEPATEQSTLGSQAFIRGGGTKFEIKHKSRCLQKSKLVNWGGQAPLAPALSVQIVVGLRNSKFSTAEPCKSKNRLTWLALGKVHTNLGYK